MDPSSLFAPGGIVQGLSNLGNSIGDSFKSYALIRKERDDADMARAKMIFDAQDKIQQQKLEQQRVDAQSAYQQGMLGAEQQRITQAGTAHKDTVAMEQKRLDAEQAARQSAQTNAARMFAAEHGSYSPTGPEPYDPTLAGISKQAQSDRSVKLATEGVAPTDMFQAPGANALTNPSALMSPTPAGSAYQNYQRKQQMEFDKDNAQIDYWKTMGGAKTNASQAGMEKAAFAALQNATNPLAIATAWKQSPEYAAADKALWRGHPSDTPPPEWVAKYKAAKQAEIQ